MKSKQFAFSALTLGFTAVCGMGTAQAASLDVVASGISNIRGISFGPDGTLYIAAPGTGGDGNCLLSPSAIFAPLCAGHTGSLLSLSPGSTVPQTILSSFQSIAEQPSGNQGAGISQLQFDSQGNAYLLTGFAGYPGNRDTELNALSANYPVPSFQQNTFPAATADKVEDTPNLAKLFKIDLKTDALTQVFDFGKYELTNNPDGGDVVSNPYDFAIKGDTAYAVDAGGNTAYKIKLDGSAVQAIALPKQTINPNFPPAAPGTPALPAGLLDVVSKPGEPLAISIQSVPTGGVIGPDGAFYVGEYTGFPYPDGKAQIFRIGDDGVPTVFADGFSHITDLAFDKAGNLDVLQFSDKSQITGEITSLPGSLIQLAPNGTRTTLVAAGEGLESADGLAIDSNGQIYIADRGVGPGLGRVLRVDAQAASVPEPSMNAGLAGSAIGIWWLQRKRRLQARKVAQG